MSCKNKELQNTRKGVSFIQATLIGAFVLSQSNEFMGSEPKKYSPNQPNGFSAGNR
jgi:hypothetical protein